MATKDPSKFTAVDAAAADDAGQTAAPAAPAGMAPPALGAACLVRVAAGVVLMNNETGGRFEAGVATPVTCTVTLLRRLQDGDLTLVA